MSRPPKNPNIPMRDGVSASSVALPSVRQPPWATVLDFLAERLHKVPRAEWLARMQRGEVLDEAGLPLPPEAPFVKCQRVYYWRELPDEQPVPFAHTVLFQDEHLVVADKPHFLPVTPGGRYVRESLLVRLKDSLNLPDLSPLHRLDRETAGVVAFSVRPADRDAYQRLFREREVSKVYEAVAPWHADLPWPQTRISHLREDPERFYRMQEVPADEATRLGLAPNSTTHLSVLAHNATHALYRLVPVSGKRHQLRVHMAALGLPIENDQFYPHVRKAPGEHEDFGTPPLQLLGRELGFADPVTGQARCFVSRQTLAAAWALLQPCAAEDPQSSAHQPDQSAPLA